MGALTMQNQIKIPKKIRIMEVGPRDGLQNEAKVVDTITKIKFIEGLVDAGIRRIEVTAFVSPRWIPQLSDQREVALSIKRVAGVSYAALVPNVQGYERAVGANVNEVSVVMAATDTHNIKNLNGDMRKVMERYREVAQRAQQDRCPFRAYISCAFGCPYEGKVNSATVLSLAKELADLGAYEIVLSDTIGAASPTSTLDLLKAALAVFPAEFLALHFHDTRGLALANIFAALTLGLSSFDASAGGLGGCPYAPGASGNVATEDLVYMLESMGIETGISLDELCDVSLHMETILGKQLPSKSLAYRRFVRTP